MLIFLFLFSYFIADFVKYPTLREGFTSLLSHVSSISFRRSFAGAKESCKLYVEKNHGFKKLLLFDDDEVIVQ